MNDNLITSPTTYGGLLQESKKIAFSMPSDLQTGSILRTLVATKPGGSFLDIGTGTGLSLSWIVDAMDPESTVLSIDNNFDYQTIAQEVFSDDTRVRIICADGNEWLKENSQERFDLVFADAWPGKFSSIDLALGMVKVGGIYLIDDLLPQPNWPEGHQTKVDDLIIYLERRTDLCITKLNWSTGLIIAAKI